MTQACVYRGCSGDAETGGPFCSEHARETMRGDLSVRLPTSKQIEAVFDAPRLQGHADVLKALRDESEYLLSQARNLKALGQEGPGKLKEETAKYLLSLVASLPTKLRAR